MFYSSDPQKIQAALPVLASMSISEMETLYNSIVSRIHVEAASSTDKFSDYSRQIVSEQVPTPESALYCIIHDCAVQAMKPLSLLKILREFGFPLDHAEKLASLWALHAEEVVTATRGAQSIKGQQLLLRGWEIQVQVADPQPMLSVTFDVGHNSKVLQLNKSEALKLFEEIQNMQREVDSWRAH